MTVLLADLLRDVMIAADASKAAVENRKVADTRLINALAIIGHPLIEKGSVVIGTTLIKRPYSMLPLELSSIENVPADSVVVRDVPAAVNPHSDLP